MDGWTGNQKLVFLEKLQTFDPPLDKAASRKLASAYDILSSQNAELLCAYFLVALKAEDDAVYERVYEFLGTIGRMKYVRPLFRALNKVKPDLATKAFEKYKDFYHPITRGMVEKDLGLAK